MNGGELKREILKRINPDMVPGMKIRPASLRACFTDEELAGQNYNMALQSLLETGLINVVEHTSLPEGIFGTNLLELSEKGMKLR